MAERRLTLDLGPVNEISTTGCGEAVGGEAIVTDHAPLALVSTDVDREATGQAQALAALEHGFALLDQAGTIDEVKEIRDRAEALRVYATQAMLSHRVQIRCAELRLRAERRAGRLLKGMCLRGGDRRSVSGSQRETLKRLGIDRNASSRWQRVAAIPVEVFDGYLDRARQSGAQITESGLVRFARQRSESKNRSDEARRRFRASLDRMLQAVEGMRQLLPHEASTLDRLRDQLEARRSWVPLAEVLEHAPAGRKLATPLVGVVAGSPVGAAEDWTGRAVNIHSVLERTAVISAAGSEPSGG